MSDVTLLANQYAASAEFLEKVNTALLRLKKAQFGAKAPEATDSELRDSREDLAQRVEAVHARLENRSAGAMIVPEEVVERLRTAYRGQLSWRLEDLQKAAAVLRGEEALSERVLKTLDELCEATDAAASASFRRLWRR